MCPQIRANTSLGLWSIHAVCLDVWRFGHVDPSASNAVHCEYGILNSQQNKVEIVQLVHAEYGSSPIVPSGEDTNIDLDALSRDTVKRIFDIITERRAALCLPSTTGEVDA